MSSKHSFNPENKEDPLKIVANMDTNFSIRQDIVYKTEFLYGTTELYDDDREFLGERLKKRYFEPFEKIEHYSERKT